MRIALFEDSAYRLFNPLSYLRPVFDLRSGILLIREKTEKRLKQPTDYFIRRLLLPLVSEQYPDAVINQWFDEDYLFINGRLLMDDALFQEIMELPAGTALKSGQSIIAAHIEAKELHNIKQDDEGLLLFPEDICVFHEKEINLPSYSWDLTSCNAREIENDFHLIGKQGIKGNVLIGAHILHFDHIFIDEGAKIYPGCVINAEEGPVYIGKNTIVHPNAVIEGPVFIGDNCRISIGSKIYQDVSIGEHCKIGGEVEGSIIHSFSNKKHEGFLGHAYLGQWVNLGADTNNSDLKNNYGLVKSYADGREVQTGSQFVGMTAGDHAKTGINTMINTGSVIGLMSNVFGAGFPPKYLPDFSWGGADGLTEYRIDKALEVAKIVKGRRGKTLTEIEAELIRFYFNRKKQ